MIRQLTAVAVWVDPPHLFLDHAARPPTRSSPCPRSPIAPPAPVPVPTPASGRRQNHPEHLRGLIGDVPVPCGDVLAIRVVTEHLLLLPYDAKREEGAPQGEAEKPYDMRPQTFNSNGKRFLAGVVLQIFKQIIASMHNVVLIPVGQA